MEKPNIHNNRNGISHQIFIRLMRAYIIGDISITMYKLRINHKGPSIGDEPVLPSG